MKHKFILLNAVIPQDFSCSLAEMVEAAEEFGCHVLMSEGLRDPGSVTMSQMYYFFTGPTKEALEQMVTATQLTGVVVETQGVYDQLETKEVVYIY